MITNTELVRKHDFVYTESSQFFDLFAKDKTPLYWKCDCDNHKGLLLVRSKNCLQIREGRFIKDSILYLEIELNGAKMEFVDTTILNIKMLGNKILDMTIPEFEESLLIAFQARNL